VPTYVDGANGVAAESLLSRIGDNHELAGGELREAPAGLLPGLIDDTNPIVEVEAKRKTLE
jgi:hypothetical protein